MLHYYVSPAAHEAVAPALEAWVETLNMQKSSSKSEFIEERSSLLQEHLPTTVDTVVE
jgi:hypothetical protein